MTDGGQTGKGLGFEAAQEAFSSQALFEDKTWRYSPRAYPLNAAQLSEIERIGQACYDFYRAQEILYLRSAEGKNLLRNRELKAPWVAEYLDRGKPAALVAHARAKALRGAMPMVIRPDLMVTSDGFALTEIDSVPGGIGLTAFLNRLYAQVHGDALIGGGEDDMLDAFYRVLCSKAPALNTPYIAILVSDEAATYRPEMEWAARELRNRGRRVHVFHPDEVMPLGDTICVGIDGDPQQIDVVYRFWELFDIANVPVAGRLLEASESEHPHVYNPVLMAAVEGDAADAPFPRGKTQSRALPPPHPGSFLEGDTPPGVVQNAPARGSENLGDGPCRTAPERRAGCSLYRR